MGMYLFGAPYRIDVYRHVVVIWQGVPCHRARILYANGERRFGYVPVQSGQPEIRIAA
jgi:hypothetical protein